MNIERRAGLSPFQWIVVIVGLFCIVFCLCYAMLDIVIWGPGNPTPDAVQPSDHPAGTTGLCRDGTYTTASHKQGACSHHNGVAVWWGP